MGDDPTTSAVTGRRSAVELQPQIKAQNENILYSPIHRMRWQEILPYDRISMNSLNLFLFLSRKRPSGIGTL